MVIANNIEQLFQQALVYKHIMSLVFNQYWRLDNIESDTAMRSMLVFI